MTDYDRLAVDRTDGVARVAFDDAANRNALDVDVADELLTESFDRDLAGQLAAETDAIAGATHTEDYRRGLAAFLGDGDAAFIGQ
ncbi:hypothetical protein ACKVMT_05510 [Halobacteriales archaeon Cl-PHB]